MLFSYLTRANNSHAARADRHWCRADVNVAGMKANNSNKGSITTPLLKDVIARDQATQKADRETVLIGQKPLNPPALYEDSGEGYNADFTFPQE